MNSFAETTKGQIFIGVVVAIIGSLFGAFVTWITLKNEPPSADLVPSMLEVEANQPINFSAAGSSDPEQDSITFRWSLNGLPFGENPAANCTPANDPAIVNCRFVMPGTHAVTVEVEDGDGLIASKSASVTVSLNNGYLSLVLNVPGGADAQAAAERAFLYAIDWREVQALVGRPIILFDPDRGASVYAATVKRDLEAAIAAITAPEVSFGGLKIGNFGLRPNVQDLIMIHAADAGLSVTFFALPAGEVMIGIERGIGEGGFTLSNSPAAFDALRADICPNC